MSKLVNKHQANDSIYSFQPLRPIIERLQLTQVHRLRHYASVSAKLSTSCIIVLQNTADHQEVFCTSMLTHKVQANQPLSFYALIFVSNLDSDPSDQKAHTSQDSDPFRSDACITYKATQGCSSPSLRSRYYETFLPSIFINLAAHRQFSQDSISDTNHHAGISSKNTTPITNAIPAFHQDYISDINRHAGDSSKITIRISKHVLRTDLHASYLGNTAAK